MKHIIQGIKFTEGTQFMVSDHSEDCGSDDNTIYTFHDVIEGDKMLISNDYEDRIYTSHRVSLLDYHKLELKLV